VTKAHTPDHYKDGFSMVAFCKVCGAEGLKLLEDCPQKIIHSLDTNELPVDLPIKSE
jgi:hypothetical protein